MSAKSDYAVLWHYTPSVAAAAIFTVLFAGLTCLHSVKLLQKRTWFCIPLVIGGLFEIIGYACRVWSHYNLKSATPYAIQSTLILLAPILFAASVYMFLGRLIRAVDGESHALIRTKWLTKIFVCSDILCFLIQAGGGGYLVTAKTENQVATGEHMILAGLILQIVIFLFFVSVAVTFNLRMSSYPTAIASSGRLEWQKLLYSLYAVSALITVRNIVRTAEYAAGATGYLLGHEWTTYVFDATLMIFVLVICYFWYGSGVTTRADLREDEERSVHLTTKSSS
ncbi:hypothetical protein MBLNU457_3182t1 [Dothideomycetes sp. NU457]